MAHRRRKRRTSARNTPVIKPGSRRTPWSALVIPALPTIAKLAIVIIQAVFGDNHMGPGPM
ncbi:hypothetical protein ACIRST_40580 [Kitasatospora sp. NPDC101447]|uniref:hypothetical protein n=1 Tax=Kitasatospora sp. NPDC101447 TaxID=3364102 RepID=UPI00382ACEDD